MLSPLAFPFGSYLVTDVADDGREIPFPAVLDRYERHFARSGNAEPAYCSALGRRLESLRKEFGFPRGNVKREVITTGADEVLEEQLALLPG